MLYTDRYTSEYSISASVYVLISSYSYFGDIFRFIISYCITINRSLVLLWRNEYK